MARPSADQWGQGFLCSKVFHPRHAQAHPLVSDLSQTTLFPTLPTSILPWWPSAHQSYQEHLELCRHWAAKGWGSSNTHLPQATQLPPWVIQKYNSRKYYNFWVTISYLPPKHFTFCTLQLSKRISDAKSTVGAAFLQVLVAYIECLNLQQKEKFIILQVSMNFSAENNTALYIVYKLP